MDPKAGRDRRNTERIPHRGEVEYWIESVHFSGWFTDISAEGICIEAANPANPGTRCRMRFSLPGSPESIEVEGVVVWSNVPMGMGVKFLTLTPDACAAIGDLTAEARST